MKFPRSNKMLHGQLDAAPFAGVFFLLVMFVVLARNLVFTPGLPIHLPASVELGGTTNLIVTVAVDAAGQLYFDNQITTETRLCAALASEVHRTHEPLTLVVHADKDVKYEMLVRLGLLAREAGIKDALLATRPQFPGAANNSPARP